MEHPRLFYKKTWYQAAYGIWMQIQGFQVNVSCFNCFLYNRTILAAFVAEDTQQSRCNLPNLPGRFERKLIDIELLFCDLLLKVYCDLEDLRKHLPYLPKQALILLDLFCDIMWFLHLFSRYWLFCFLLLIYYLDIYLINYFS